MLVERCPTSLQPVPQCERAERKEHSVCEAEKRIGAHVLCCVRDDDEECRHPAAADEQVDDRPGHAFESLAAERVSLSVPPLGHNAG